MVVGQLAYCTNQCIPSSAILPASPPAPASVAPSVRRACLSWVCSPTRHDLTVEQLFILSAQQQQHNLRSFPLMFKQVVVMCGVDGVGARCALWRGQVPQCKTSSKSVMQTVSCIPYITRLSVFFPHQTAPIAC